MVETLNGREDDRPQAEALARDYAVNPGRFVPAAGPAVADAIPELGGADADSDRRPRSAARQPRAGGLALPHPAA
jgi:hypothetical protein